MRHFPPLLHRSKCTTLVQILLFWLVSLPWLAHADIYDDVERLIRNGQLERAAQLGTTHLQNTPQDPQMRLLVSRILETQGKTDSAIEQLETLTREYPELPEPHNNLAVLYARQGRTQDAIDSLNKALMARPDYTVALENLGDLHLSLALQAYRRAGTAPNPPASASRKADTLAPLIKR